jgi:hypothetical protein
MSGMRLTGYLRGRVLLMFATWLLAVGVATGVGFGALRMIGNGVTDRARPPLSEQAVTSSAGSAAGSANGRVTPATPATPTTPTTTAPRTSNTRTGPRGVPAGGSDSEPGDETTPSAPSSGSQDEVKAFPTRGGTVFATCTGSRISFRAAYPMDGYRSEVGARGPDKVEVEFDDHGSRSHVALRCVSGVPTPVHDDNGQDGHGDR